MTKTFFHRVTGNPCVFESDARLEDWPDFQEFPFPEVITRGSVLAIRKKALVESDWMAMSDRTISQEQRDYRQALRDITSQVAFTEERYDDIAWPAKPVETGTVP